MSAGKNNGFKVVLNRRDIVEITELSKQLRIDDQDFIRNATYEDVHAAYNILGLIEYMNRRNVEPGFELVLSE